MKLTSDIQDKVMDIFGGIEKLINEHGSAAILKERLDLVADKYADLEQKLSDSTLKQKDIEIEKKNLELENLKLQERIRALEKKLSNHHPADRILSFICYNQDASEAEIADGVGVAIATVRHWLDFYKKQGKMLDENDQVTGEAIHYLSNKGLA